MYRIYEWETSSSEEGDECTHHEDVMARDQRSQPHYDHHQVIRCSKTCMKSDCADSLPPSTNAFVARATSLNITERFNLDVFTVDMRRCESVNQHFDLGANGSSILGFLFLAASKRF